MKFKTNIPAGTIYGHLYIRDPKFGAVRRAFIFPNYQKFCQFVAEATGEERVIIKSWRTVARELDKRTIIIGYYICRDYLVVERNRDVVFGRR